MTDRELLELAAKAAGFANFEYASQESGICIELGSRRGAITSYWNPLTDDGDALRLAVKLGIDVKHYDYYVVAWFDRGYTETGKIPYGGDPYAATRRAIVRSAAEIGKVMP